MKFFKVLIRNNVFQYPTFLKLSLRHYLRKAGPSLKVGHTHTTGESIRYSIKSDILCRFEIYPQSVPSNLTPDTLIRHNYMNVNVRPA